MARTLDLGADPGSVVFVDKRTLAYWFGEDGVVSCGPIASIATEGS